MYYKIHSYLFKDCYRLLHTNRQLWENHYETLNLPKDCTTKQIREKFIKLSKQYHPDKNNDKDAHSKYVRIQEAYSVLSKPHSRHDYDLGLSNPYRSYQHTYPHYRDAYYYGPNARTRRHGRNPWDDPSFWANRNRDTDNKYGGKPYYGINGIERVSNASIVAVCLILTLFGVTLQILAVRHAFNTEMERRAKRRHSVTIRRDQMIARSNEFQKNLDEIKRVANENGNEVQLAILKKRLMIKDDKDDGV